MGEWAFLLDENVERAVADKLEQEGFDADLVVDELGPGAEDLHDVIPHAVENNQVIVTKDVSDFASLGVEDHEGIVVVHSHRLTAFETATALVSLVKDYGDRGRLRHTEVLDEYV